MKRLPLTTILLILAGGMAASSPITGHPPAANHTGREMASAASAFRESLDPALRQRACFDFDDRERLDWHFVPKDRPGVPLKEMQLASRRAAHRLLRSALSDKGYLKATSIMALEEILRDLEHERPNVQAIRDQEKYHFSVFGEPGDEDAWGWRVEGHHLSLNFALHGGQVIAVTPSFYGANPAEVREGPRAGWRVLGGEEDLARAIMAAADETQQQHVVIAAEAPRDVITGPGQSIDVGQPAGRPAAEMTGAQRALLRQLVGAFAHNLRGELAEKELAEIDQAGFDNIRFAWAGSQERGQGHYFRIHGPTFIIEYDNTQNQANHVHAVWHSLQGDFGLDFLRRHHAESAQHAFDPQHPQGTPGTGSPIRRLLYVASPGIRNYLEYGGHGVLVFDIDEGHRFVRRISLAGYGVDENGKVLNVKGVCASAVTDRLYVSTLRQLICLDLTTDQVLWQRAYEHGCDRMSMAPDGSVICLPSLEKHCWYVVDARNGSEVARIEPDSGAHNTVFGRDGRHVYLAGLRSALLTVADTATHSTVRTVGPFSHSIRPFTVNGQQTLCFVNVNELLGFEVGDLSTGEKLHRVEVAGFRRGPVKRHGCPSHGIGLTPDEREIWVTDGHNRRLHIFDVSRLPPRQLESMELRDEPGWVTFSLRGDLAYPSTGEVIDVKSRKIVATLSDETGRIVMSEKMLEIDFDGNDPVQAGDQFGIGRRGAHGHPATLAR